MFAVIKTGGNQHKVTKNSIIKVEKIDGSIGSEIEFDQVFMLGDEFEDISFIGTPTVLGAKVIAKITNQFKDDKIIIFKKTRRNNDRTKNGHRQFLTELKIIDIIKQ